MRQTLHPSETIPASEITAAPSSQEAGKGRRRLSPEELDALMEGQPELAMHQTDKYAVHKRIIDDIDALRERQHSDTPEDTVIQRLRSEIVVNAIDLAAQFLSKDTLERHGIRPLILDNASVYHPPTTQEVLLLETAWEATHHDALWAVFEDSIHEVPNQSEKELLEHALEEFRQSKEESFMSAYIHAEAQRLRDEGVDLDRINRPNAYMAFGRCLPIQETMKALIEYSDSHDALGANNERLIDKVVPIPDNYLDGNKAYSTSRASQSENTSPSSRPPMIYFPDR